MNVDVRAARSSSCTAVSIAARTWWWISSLSEMGSSSCAPTDLLVRFLTARSSGGRLPGRPAGRALHQPEECAIFLFPHEWGRHLSHQTVGLVEFEVS